MLQILVAGGSENRQVWKLPSLKMDKYENYQVFVTEQRGGDKREESYQQALICMCC